MNTQQELIEFFREDCNLTQAEATQAAESLLQMKQEGTLDDFLRVVQEARATV